MLLSISITVFPFLSFFLVQTAGAFNGGGEKLLPAPSQTRDFHSRAIGARIAVNFKSPIPVPSYSPTSGELALGFPALIRVIEDRGWLMMKEI